VVVINSLFNFCTRVLGWVPIVVYDPNLMVWALADLGGWFASEVATSGSKDWRLNLLVTTCTTLVVACAVALLLEQPVYNALVYYFLASFNRLVLVFYAGSAIVVNTHGR